MRVDVKGDPVPGGGSDVRRVPAGRASLATGTGETLLRLRGISKTFGPVQALTGVDLDIPAGRVTALVGDKAIAVIMISRSLTDVFKVADRMAVLYLGRLVTVGPASDFDTAAAVHWMTAGTSPNGQATRKAEG